MQKDHLCLRFALLVSLFAVSTLVVGQTAQGPSTANASPGVPRLIKFGGTLKDVSGSLLIDTVGITFTVYSDQTNGVPLWQETQNIQFSQGRYTVLLGQNTTGGIPAEIFASGQPRWLGVRILMPGEVEQPRVMMASVPYALKAVDADTLGGLPASAFLKSGDGATISVSSVSANVPTGKSVLPPISSTVTTSGGTVGAVPVFSTATDVENSHITDSGGTVNITEPLSVGVAGGVAASSVNNVINPLVCGGSAPPSWCNGGSDLGAWINAAINVLPGDATGGLQHGCGIIQLPSNASSQNSPILFSTQINKPRCTIIDLNQATIQYTGTTSPAIMVGDAANTGAEVLGAIQNGRILGSTGSTPSTYNGISLGDINVAATKGFFATNQVFYNLNVQNFNDDFMVGSNAYSDTWLGGVIALSKDAGIHFIGFAGLTNEGENFSFNGTNFGNNEQHDVLVDSGAFAEINASGTSFDYAGFNPTQQTQCPASPGSDSISSGGTLIFNAGTSHFERCNANSTTGAKVINCSGHCSVAVSASSMWLKGQAGAGDAFGQFAATSNATFNGVDFENIGQTSTSLRQLFTWSNNTGSLDLLSFRNAEGGPSLGNIPLYSGTAPLSYFDSRVTGSTGHATCWKSGGQIGYCSGPLNSSGICTCK